MTGTFVYAGCQLIVVSVLAKLTNPNTVGCYALALAVANPIFAFTGLQLKNYFGTDVQGEFSIESYLSVRSISSLFGCTVLAVISLVIFGPGELFQIIMLIGIIKTSDSLSDIIYGFFQSRGLLNIPGISLLLRSVFGAGIFIIAITATGSLKIAMASLAGSWIIVLICFDFRTLSKHCMFRFKNLRRSFASIIRKTLPMGLSLVAGSLIVSIPRYTLKHYRGMEEVGVYSVLFYIVTFHMLLGGTINQAVSSRLATLYKCKHPDYIKLLLRCTCLCAFISMFAFFAGHIWGTNILRCLFTEDYAKNQWAIDIMFLGGIAIVLDATIDYSLLIMRRLKTRLFINLAALAIITFSCFVLVRRSGILGAAIAFAIVSWAKAATSLAVVITVLYRERFMSERVPINPTKWLGTYNG